MGSRVLEVMSNWTKVMAFVAKRVMNMEVVVTEG